MIYLKSRGIVGREGRRPLFFFMSKKGGDKMLTRIKAERLKRGWTLLEVQRRAGLHYTEGSRIEGRKQVAGEKAKERITGLFGLEEAALFEQETGLARIDERISDEG